MSTGIDIQFVREAYQKMPDNELVRTLTQDARGLTTEALEVVKEEVKRRNLDPNILKGLDAQQKSYTAAEIDSYCALIQQLPCPVAGHSYKKLNAILTTQVMSFILFTHWRKKIVIGSPEVLDKANNDALTISLILGWWGIPQGPIRTIQAIRIGMKNKKISQLDTPSEYLRAFVLSNIGQIETYKDNPGKLAEIISGN